MYESDWVNVYIDDVELPDRTHIEHHVLDFRKGSAGAVLVDDSKRILLIWRHRFVTDRWGWEVPAGWIDGGEDPETAVRREIEEETGYRAGHIEPMVDYFPLAGISTQHYWTYVATQPEYIREGRGNETTRLEWISIAEIPKLARAGLITDGPSLLMLSYFLGVHGSTDSARP
jgi:8-oxo-dGTP pyrophosphatase MutT (NUDIX family)